jgi:hypothetical protein
MIYRLFLIILFSTFSNFGFTQIGGTSEFKPDPVKEAKFLPYLAVRHGGMPAIEEWKKNNTVQYYKELWYYTESFYIRRNYVSQGTVLDESLIDISRYESNRKENEEAIVTFPGSRDALILLPARDLIYKP